MARPIRPCCVESSPYVRRQSGNCDAACRRTYLPVRTSSSVARTLPCRLAESPDFSPPPSPAIFVSATFSSLARLMDARAGCEMVSTQSPLGVLANAHPARASTKRAKLPSRKVVETAIADEGGGEKSGDSAGRQGSVRATELDVMTGTDEHLHAASNVPDWCLTQGLDSTQQGRIGRATTASRVHRPRPRQTPRDGPDSVLETVSSRRRTLTVSTSCF